MQEICAATKTCSKESSKLSSLLHSKVFHKIKKQKLSNAASKILKISRKNLGRKRSQNRKTRKDTLPQETKMKVINFYNSPQISLERPEVRFRGKRLMAMSNLQAFNLFRKTHLNTSIGLTTFLKLRPKNVLVFKSYHFNCKYTYCNNIEILLKSINRCISTSPFLVQGSKVEMKLITVYLQEVIMCEKPAGNWFHDVECIKKKCDVCADTKASIIKHYRQLMNEKSTAILKWQQWQRMSVKVNVRKNGKFEVEDRMKLVLVSKQGNLESALCNLATLWDYPCQGIDMRSHLLNASWQNLQFEKCKKLVDQNTAVVVYDFARNFATLHQDEVKSSAFAKHQITIHPVPMYYIEAETNKIVRETLVITSDDITHDVSAVSAFGKAVIAHLIKRKVTFKHLIEWSDGCESQYKGVKKYTSFPCFIIWHVVTLVLV